MLKPKNNNRKRVLILLLFVFVSYPQYDKNILYIIFKGSTNKECIFNLHCNTLNLHPGIVFSTKTKCLGILYFIFNLKYYIMICNVMVSLIVLMAMMKNFVNLSIKHVISGSRFTG